MTGPTDIERLYRVRALRQLGLPLDEIRRALDDPATDLGDLHRQRRALQAVRSSMSTHDLIRLLEVMTMPDGTIERHISILVYADLEAAFNHLVDVFGLGPARSPSTATATSSTANSRPATLSSGCTRSPQNSDCRHLAPSGHRRR